MGSALITIEQEIQGQTYETVHCAQSELDLIGEDGLPSEGFMLELFNGTLPDTTFSSLTDPANEVYSANDFGLIGALVAFHRHMQTKLVRLTRVYISDGKKAGGGNPNIFYSLPLDLPCRGIGLINDSIPENVAPANQAILLSKVPKGFGKRAGHIFLRCALLNESLMVGGPNGVQLKPAAQSPLEGRIGTALTGSGLVNFFDTGTDADQASVYAIANYYPKAAVDADPTKKGQLQGSTGVTALRYDGITGRQTNRPSKRK